MLEDRLSEMEKWVRSRVSQPRWQHTQGVVNTCVALAQKWGADNEEAHIAGLLHDCCRDVPKSLVLKMADDFGIVKDELAVSHPVLLHGPVGAWEAQIKFMVSNDVFDAIFYHTTGRPGMGLLEKCLFLADALEPNRDYPGISTIRELAFRDLDQAVLMVLSNGIVYIVQSGQPLHHWTVEARNYMLKSMG